MSGRLGFEHTLDYLRSRWREVCELEGDACRGVYDEFVSKYVREDLHRRFGESFNRSGVQPRCYADRGRDVGRDAPIETWLTGAKGTTPEVIVCAVWGVKGSLQGVRLEGSVGSMRELVITDDDAIVRVQSGRFEVWVFMPHDSDEAWVMN